MPAGTIDRQTLGNVVQLACRAPSLHNCQPWRLIAGTASFGSSSSRTGTGSRPQRPEVVISCGALLDHLRVAAAAAGWDADVARFPPIPTTSTIWPPSTSAAANWSPTPPGPAPTRILARRSDSAAVRDTGGLAGARAAAARRSRSRTGDAARAARLRAPPGDRVVPADRGGAPLRQRLQRRVALVDSAVRSGRRAAHDALAAASEQGQSRDRPQLPAQRPRGPPPEVPEDHSVIAVLSTSGNDRRASLGCGRRCRRCCWRPPWPGWPPARSATSPRFRPAATSFGADRGLRGSAAADRFGTVHCPRWRIRRRPRPGGRWRMC